jgi:endonuclease/exonuclease/phosphatase family metal-dependent hydrolase
LEHKNKKLSIDTHWLELQLKLALFNVENFFLTEPQYQNVQKKPDDKVNWIAKITEEISPDIFMLCEVGGLDSLERFNKNYLNNNFMPLIIPGNSDRGIEIGYLIKKALPFTYQHISHRDMNFSRDVSELRILKDNRLVLIILLVHLKSKWDREGNDPNGFLKRSHEIEALLEISKSLDKEFPLCPIIIAGDLNGVAQKNNCEREFREIYKQTTFTDILDILDLPEEERITFVHFQKDGKPDHFQLDYIFLPLTLKDKVKKEESGIYQYKNIYDIPIELPKNPFERYALPSDHYPLVLSLDFLQ